MFYLFKFVNCLRDTELDGIFIALLGNRRYVIYINIIIQHPLDIFQFLKWINCCEKKYTAVLMILVSFELPRIHYPGSISYMKDGPGKIIWIRRNRICIRNTDNIKAANNTIANFQLFLLGILKCIFRNSFWVALIKWFWQSFLNHLPPFPT